MTTTINASASAGLVQTADTSTILQLQTASTAALTIDGSQNVGIGVTPSAWGGVFTPAFQLRGAALASQSNANITHLMQNTYFNSSNLTYIATDYAVRYTQYQGQHQWYNAPSGTAGNAITFTQAMTLDASGRLLLGPTSGTGMSASDLGMLNGGSIRFRNAANSAYLNMINVDSSNNLNFGVGGVPTIITFGISGVGEAARIDSSGTLLVGKTASSFGTAGIEINVGGGKYCTFTRSGGGLADFNRLSDDGELISFNQDSTKEGNISVSGTTVSYNGGHLARYAQTTTAKDNSLVKGTVLSNLDAMNEYIAPTTYWTEEDELPENVNVGDIKVETHEVANEQLNKVKVSDVEGDANVAGVFVNWSYDEQHSVDEINMAMTGDMIIRIAQGVTVHRGDLLMSAGDGTAKAQGDDIVRSKTIAKVTSNHVTCTYADGSYCVPCVLMAC